MKTGLVLYHLVQQRDERMEVYVSSLEMEKLMKLAGATFASKNHLNSILNVAFDQNEKVQRVYAQILVDQMELCERDP